MKEEFVCLAQKEGANFSQLCRRFRISRKNGYKWLRRYQLHGSEGLQELSRKPKTQPSRTSQEVEALIVALRQEHPAWGARKLKKRLESLGYQQLPACSTITAILERHGQLHHLQPSSQGPWKRFCRQQPNELWQMDFKGQFQLKSSHWCYPLTILDDYSRYSLTIAACSNQHTRTVQYCLSQVFERYGLPECILADNGPPWGCSSSLPRYTQLGVWLLRLGVDLIHGRPYHPQTQGKQERFHRTLKLEVLNRTTCWKDFAHVQSHFDRFRYSYNQQRPHHALDLEVPSQRYLPSKRCMPQQLPALEYLEDDEIRRVNVKGAIRFQGHYFHVGEAFQGLPVALRRCIIQNQEGWQLFFGWKNLGSLELFST